MAKTRTRDRRVQIHCAGPVTFSQPASLRAAGEVGDGEAATMESLLARIEALEVNDRVQDTALEVLLNNTDDAEPDEQADEAADFLDGDEL